MTINMYQADRNFGKILQRYSAEGILTQTVQSITTHTETAKKATSRLTRLPTYQH